MILVINTADSEEVFIGLVKDGAWIAKKQFKAKARQAEKLLPAIDKILQATSYKLQAIAVVSGPASFTALRIGVVTANTLAWSKKIPVVSIRLNEFKNLNDLAKKVSSKNKSRRFRQRRINANDSDKNEEIVKPYYGKEPNVTMMK